MTNIKRRDFVMLASAIPLLASTQLNAGQDAGSEFGVVGELRQVIAVWFAEMCQTPAEYLSDCGVDLSDSAQIKQHSIADFKEGKVIEVNGLVLSQTEAAILSEFVIATLT